MDLEDVIEFASVTVRSHRPIAIAVYRHIGSHPDTDGVRCANAAQCLNEATGKTILNCLKAGAK